MYGTPKLKRVLQYIWDPEPRNTDHEHKIVCLGKVYDPIFKSLDSMTENKSSYSSDTNESADAIHLSSETSSSTSKKPTTSLEWPHEFLEDVESKLWFTYRTNFPIIPFSQGGPSSISIGRLFRGSGIESDGFSSDVGWGCMIRTSQSLLANCIVILELGREWKRPTLSTTLSTPPKDKTSIDGPENKRYHVSNVNVDKKEVEIISMFADHPGCLFSVHNFVKHGEAACGKKAGEWFGPSAAASSIKALHQQKLASHKNNTQKEIALQTENTPSYEPRFRVFISSGSDVYEKPFMKTAISEDSVFYPTLILLGLRLGIDKVNQVYWDSIKAFLASPQAMGIAGGRPSSSHYFYGYQGDNLFYLDPHQPKPALDPESITADVIETVHTRRIRHLHLNEMDPSMLMGVLIKDKDDWESWKQSVDNGPMKSIIHISLEPMELRRSSVSVSNDDDFIDVLLEPEEEDENGLGDIHHAEGSEDNLDTSNGTSPKTNSGTNTESEEKSSA